MKLLINISSYSDIITNSSSEFFLCNSNKTKTELEKLLNDYIIKHDNKYSNIIDIYDYSERLNKEIESIFGKNCSDDIKKNILTIFKKGNKFDKEGNVYFIEIPDDCEETIDFIKNDLGGGIYK